MPGSWELQRTADGFPFAARWALAPAALPPASSLRLCVAVVPFLWQPVLNVSASSEKKKNEPLQMRRDIELLGKKEHKTHRATVQVKAVTAERTEDSNSGTRFVLRRPPLRAFDKEFSNIPFFVSRLWALGSCFVKEPKNQKNAFGLFFLNVFVYVSYLIWRIDFFFFFQVYF